MVDEDLARQQEVGRRVRRLRRRRGLNRRQFADLCGRSPSWVDKIETGERGLLRLPMVERVAEVLGVPVDVLTGGAEHENATPCLDAFEVSAIRAALQRYDAITTVLKEPSPDEPPDLDRVRQQVTYAWSSFQNAHYSRLGRALPALLRDAQDAAGSKSGCQAEAQALLSQAYQVTASALFKVKEVDLAWLAAERGLSLAERVGDDLLISDAARRVAHGLMLTDHGDQALRLLRAGIDHLEPGVSSADPEYLSLYGMLFLLGSFVAGKEGWHSTARDLITAGQAVAVRIGEGRNERWTAFGPTNVTLHHVATLVQLGDGGEAIRVAERATPDGLAALPRERRANFFVDIAHANAQESRRDDAVSALLRAEQLAPDEVRCRPPVVGLVSDLLRRGPGRPSLALRQLAVRIGLRDVT